MEVDLTKAYNMFNMKRKNDISGGVANFMDKVIKAHSKSPEVRVQELKALHSNFCDVYADQVVRASKEASVVKAKLGATNTEVMPVTQPTEQTAVRPPIMSCVDIVGAGKKKSLGNKTVFNPQKAVTQKKRKGGMTVLGAVDTKDMTQS